MRKILFAALFLLPAGLLHAFDYGQKVQSSQSEVATGLNLPVMISSAPIQFTAVTVSSPAQNGLIVLYKSTGSTFTADIATWTKVDCSYQAINTNPVTLPLFDIEHTSYTFMQVVGNCARTMWFRWIPPFPEPANDGRYKSFGLNQKGQR